MQVSPELGYYFQNYIGFVNQWEKNYRVGGYSLPGMRACAIPLDGASEKYGSPIPKYWNSFKGIGIDFVHAGISKLDSPFYNENFANRTYIPIKSPE